ncbi:DUF7322 domain-containing protein [Salinigranum marinum]|uniref:DUF7322 domain-containing protein n=1 Tax=Salinigranum marinum TaxID=1515595 RepID=UPI002989F122|nr:hypothetical protein [Salinigranum marinum]
MDDDWFDDSESLYPDGMDGPTIEAPSVDVPTAAGDIFQQSKVAQLFVLHVFVWNAVVLLVSLGAMLIYFRNDWTTGSRLLVAGGVLTAYGLYRWPRGTDESDTDVEDADVDNADVDNAADDESDGDREGPDADGDAPIEP